MESDDEDLYNYQSCCYHIIDTAPSSVWWILDRSPKDLQCGTEYIQVNDLVRSNNAPRTLLHANLILCWDCVRVISDSKPVLVYKSVENLGQVRIRGSTHHRRGIRYHNCLSINLLSKVLLHRLRQLDPLVQLLHFQPSSGPFNRCITRMCIPFRGLLSWLKLLLSSQKHLQVTQNHEMISLGSFKADISHCHSSANNCDISIYKQGRLLRENALCPSHYFRQERPFGSLDMPEYLFTGG